MKTLISKIGLALILTVMSTNQTSAQEGPSAPLELEGVPFPDAAIQAAPDDTPESPERMLEEALLRYRNLQQQSGQFEKDWLTGLEATIKRVEARVAAQAKTQPAKEKQSSNKPSPKTDVADERKPVLVKADVTSGNKVAPTVESPFERLTQDFERLKQRVKQLEEQMKVRSPSTVAKATDSCINSEEQN